MSTLFLNRYVLNVCTKAAVSSILLRGVISESNSFGIDDHAFSSKMLTTCAGYKGALEKVFLG